MKSAVLLCLAAFAVAASAQQPAQSSNEKLKLQAAAEAQKVQAWIAAASRCPIAMDARQGGGLHILRAQDGSKIPQEPAMTPSLTLTAPQDRQILSATITAHGYAASRSAMPLEVQYGGVQGGVAKMEPLGPPQSATPSKAPNQPIALSHPAPVQRPQLTRTVTVKFASNGDGSFSGDFRLPGFAVLETIDLNSVTFAGGSTWSFTSASGCHVQPDPFMLVGSSLARP